MCRELDEMFSPVKSKNNNGRNRTATQSNSPLKDDLELDFSRPKQPVPAAAPVSDSAEKIRQAVLKWTKTRGAAV
jgi:hypothetical protein